ncbi:MAG: bacillithiol synthase, partial [Mucilaginibacter sp.]|nr:bacillithiol synthase [Mucilaginibacter sp.]
MDASCINYKDTGYFSQTVIDYIEDAPNLRPFYGHRPDLNGFAALLKHKKVIADRDVLVKVLQSQYSRISHLTSHISHLVKDNISLLASDNTYTVTTGHQLNIFAGPLYFIYKIVTAIKLSREL